MKLSGILLALNILFCFACNTTGNRSDVSDTEGTFAFPLKEREVLFRCEQNNLGRYNDGTWIEFGILARSEAEVAQQPFLDRYVALFVQHGNQSAKSRIVGSDSLQEFEPEQPVYQSKNWMTKPNVRTDGLAFHYQIFNLEAENQVGHLYVTSGDKPLYLSRAGSQFICNANSTIRYEIDGVGEPVSWERQLGDRPQDDSPREYQCYHLAEEIACLNGKTSQGCDSGMFRCLP